MVNSLHKINRKEKKYSPIDFTFATKWWYFVERVCLNSYSFNVHFSGECVSNRNIVNIMCCSPNCKTDNNKSSRTTEKIKWKNTCFFMSLQPYSDVGLLHFLWDILVTAVLHTGQWVTVTLLWSVLIKIVFCLHYMSVVYNAIIAAWLFAL